MVCEAVKNTVSLFRSRGCLGFDPLFATSGIWFGLTVYVHPTHANQQPSLCQITVDAAKKHPTCVLKTGFLSPLSCIDVLCPIATARS